MLKNNFDGLMVKLASDADIRNWSKWEVESPDTINYRTWKPKQSWLFCEAIFGPVKNYECNCGKYKWVRYKWIVCERCGVEVATSRVRRERMWHIALAAPVIHVWYMKATPSRVGLLLNLSVNEIEKILFFVKYIVVWVDEKQKKNIVANLDQSYKEKLKELDKVYQEELLSDKSKEKELEIMYNDNKLKLEKEYSRIKSILMNLDVWSTILESDYRNIFFKYEWAFTFESWSQAILNLLSKIDLRKEISDLLETFYKKKWEDRKKAFKKLRLLINLHVSWSKPEWMAIKNLPVIPPDLRPVVQLEWWKFASSDVNLFYRRVLMRNIRLKKMIKVWMPDVVKKNEIRLLQESVNNLFVWEKNVAWKGWAWVKVFKSLTDMLSGKEWIFRKNLLWKRVDYSWRSVITVWPNLKLDECGVPLYIAIKIFTPFIIAKLIEKQIAYTPRQAEKLIKDEKPVALKVLKEVIKDKYVLLNRAPTLHRLWIQAFKIKLMPWKTIRIHPLVCPAFNADFDGDQMAIHLPLWTEAQEEAKNIICSDKNILKPSSWEPIITHTQDMILWIYNLTSDHDINDDLWIFDCIESVVSQYYVWNITIKDAIKVRFNSEIIETTVWRVLFNNILPEKIQFINDKITKRDLKKILDNIYDEYWREVTIKVSDDLKDLWFHFATTWSVTVNVFDMFTPPQKKKILSEWESNIKKIHDFWYKWFISDEEKHLSIIKIWSDVKHEIEKNIKKIYKAWNDIHLLIDSWARWTWSQLTQISWMKWLVQSPSGEIIELPIKSSLIEWFTPVEYFISAHWGRKWKADTALRTAESGYLTRRLVDSSQELVIKEDDCKTNEYLMINRNEEFKDDCYWRTLFEDVLNSKWNKILNKLTILDKKEIKVLNDSDVEFIKVRTPLTCRSISWVCQKCYGMDLSNREEVNLWTPVWVISSQSIWEPGTQLTMRTFHTWWVASDDWDMTQGIKRLEELFEIRKPKKPALVSPFDWVVKIVESWKLTEVNIIGEIQEINYFIKDWYTSVVKKWDTLKKWWSYAIKWRSSLQVKEEWKIMRVTKSQIILWVSQKAKKTLSVGTSLKISSWDKVYKWQILSTWSLDIREYSEVMWWIYAQKYIVQEIRKVFQSQWQDVNDKHVEVIVKQLFSKVLVEDSWDSSFVPGTIVKYEEFMNVNDELKKEKKQLSKWERLALWLTQVAKESDGWMAAASFQETIRVMVESSTKWAIDNLEDLKSNVIIWRRLPVWSEYLKIYNWLDKD